MTDPAFFNVNNGTWSQLLSSAAGGTLSTRNEVYGATNFAQVPLNAPFPALIRLGVLNPGSGQRAGATSASAGFGSATRSVGSAGLAVTIPIDLAATGPESLLPAGPLGRRKVGRTS